VGLAIAADRPEGDQPVAINPSKNNRRVFVAHALLRAASTLVFWMRPRRTDNDENHGAGLCLWGGLFSRQPPSGRLFPRVFSRVSPLRAPLVDHLSEMATSRSYDCRNARLARVIPQES
jgi:hypothetical protein